MNVKTGVEGGLHRFGLEDQGKDSITIVRKKKKKINS